MNSTTVQFRWEANRWQTAIPWHYAERVHHQLKDRGLLNTLCLEPNSRLAVLELWPGMTPEIASGVLRELLAASSSRRHPPG
jgi:hypothetical protein